jgi:hypothetical protein
VVCATPRSCATGVEVEHLAAARGHQAHVALELQQVGHAADLAHVALDVGGQVAGMPLAGRNGPVVQGGVEAGREQRVEAESSQELGRLRIGQGQQLHIGRAAGQALADLARQQQVLRTGEDEVPHVTAGIGLGLQIGQELRHMLHLVDDNAAAPALDEATRVGRRLGAGVELFQRYVGVAGEGAARQGGLARLPRTTEHHHRKAARQTKQARLCQAGKGRRRERAGDHGFAVSALKAEIVKTARPPFKQAADPSAVKRLDHPLQLDQHRPALAVDGLAGGNLDPAFADAVLVDVEAFLAVEADADRVLGDGAVVVRAGAVDRPLSGKTPRPPPSA